jgi:hypothetical protein
VGNRLALGFAWIVDPLTCTLFLELAITFMDFDRSDLVLHESPHFLDGLFFCFGNLRGPLCALFLQLPLISVLGDVVIIHVSSSYVLKTL